MPKPYIFESREHLVRELRAPATHELAQTFFSARTTTLCAVIREGVSGNTFRAFRKLPVAPSIAFREWTTNRLEQTLPQLLTAIESHAYADYVHSMTLDLEEYWHQRTHSEIGYGRGAKLLNLVLKKLACYQALTADQRTRLINLLHVPLDSHTIVGLRNIATQLHIPKSATMKFVTTQERYNQFQAEIAAIAAEAGIPAIYYDILAWDWAHPRLK